MKIINNVEKDKIELMKYRLKGIEPLLVVAGLVEKNGKYLIAKRKNGDELVVNDGNTFIQIQPRSYSPSIS